MNLSSYDYHGLKVLYRPDTEDEKVIAHSFDNDIFYREIPSFKTSKNPVIIDVGAHIGTFSLLSAIKYPNATIYAIEASRETYNILKRNIEENHLQNVIPIHAAMSSKEGILKLYHSLQSGNWGHSVTKVLSDSYEEVDSITLGGVIEEKNICQIDLIKFNCEGAEFDILINADESTIKKINCGIILYHEDLVESGYTKFQLIGIFKDKRFRVINIQKGKSRGWVLLWNKRFYSNFYFLISALKRKLTK